MSLPDIAGLAALSPPTLRAFARRLAGLGLTLQRVAPIVAAVAPLAPPLRRPIRSFHLRRIEEPVGLRGRDPPAARRRLRAGGARPPGAPRGAQGPRPGADLHGPRAGGAPPGLDLTPDLLFLLTFLHESATVPEGIARFAEQHEMLVERIETRILPKIEEVLLTGMLEVA